MSEVGAEMVRRQEWRDATDVVTTATGRELVVRNDGTAAVTVPLTVPEGTLDVVTVDEDGHIVATGDPTGTPYAGQRSTWVTVPAGGSVTFQLPNVHTFRSPATWPLPSSLPVPPPTPEAVIEGPTTEPVELPEARSEIIEPEQTDDGSSGPTPDEPVAEGSPPSAARPRTATR
jgi:hypothetical protein